MSVGPAATVDLGTDPLVGVTEPEPEVVVALDPGPTTRLDDVPDEQPTNVSTPRRQPLTKRGLRFTFGSYGLQGQ